MTSNNKNCFPPNALSGQHCENYDVKRETVHCYPRNVDRCCTWLECAVEGGLILSQEFQRVLQNLLCFVLLYTSSRETVRFSGNKIHCSPRDQSLSVYYYPRNVDRCSTWSEVAWRCRWDLSAFFKICICFVLLHNKSLNDWSLREQWILFPSNLNVSLDFVSGNIETLGKQNSLFPSGPVTREF